MREQRSAKSVTEHMQFPALVREWSAIGRRELGNTNLLREGAPLDHQDTLAFRKFLHKVAPVTQDNFRTYEHLLLTSTFAHDMGEAFKAQNPDKYEELNPDELEITGLTHDMGRLVTHRYYLNEVLERRVLRRVGMQKKIVENNPPVSPTFDHDPNDPDEVALVFDGFSTEARITILADMCGKRLDDGEIMTFEKAMDYHNRSRTDYSARTGLSPEWSFEDVLSPRLRDFSGKIYRKLFEWSRHEGVDPESIRQSIRSREKSAEVQVVIFDLGNVLIPNPDPDIFVGVERAFGIEKDELEPGWIGAISGLQTGNISTDEFWNLFALRTNRRLPEGYHNLLTDPLVTTGDPQILELINQLKKAQYTVGAHSDTVPPHADTLREAGLLDVFDEVTFSPEIGMTKNDPKAFRVSAVKLWLPPEACVFVDDKSGHIDRARKAGMKGIVYTGFESLTEGLAEYGIRTD